jgi:hypothetical protein
MADGSNVAVSGSVFGNDVPMRTVTLVESPDERRWGFARSGGGSSRALLEAGLVEQLEAAGVAVRRGGQVTPLA